MLSIRKILRSPAYRLGALRPWKRVSTTWVWLLTAGGLWVLATYCLLYAALSDDSLVSFIEPYFWVLCHVLMIVSLAMAASLAGAQAFAPEYRCGTMDQFVALPIPRTEVILGRALAALGPLLPAMAVAGFGNPFVLHLVSLALDDVPALPPPIAGWFACLGVLSTVLLAFVLGLYASLQMRAGGSARLRGLGLLLLAFLGDVAIVLLSYRLFSLRVGSLLVLCIWHLALVALLLTYCIRRFDVLILRGISGG